MATFDPVGVIIDGAVPRDASERCIALLAYLPAVKSAAIGLRGWDLNDFQHDIDVLEGRVVDLMLYEARGEEVDWNELELDICEFIASSVNALELDQYEVILGEHDPGDVIVRQTARSLTCNRLKDISYFLKTRLYTKSTEPIEAWPEDKQKTGDPDFSFVFTDHEDNDYRVSIIGPEDV